MDEPMEAPRKLSPEAVQLFNEGISLILSRWSALQMAVENEWGGRGSRQIAEQLVSDVFSWFTQSKEPLYIDDLENILEEAMSTLNTVIEDGSIEEVAEKVTVMHEECLDRKYTSIEKLRQAKSERVVHQHIRQAVNDDDDSDGTDDDDDDDDGGSSMMVDVPQSQSKPRAETVTENTENDGWVTVTSRRNRGNRD